MMKIAQLKRFSPLFFSLLFITILAFIITVIKKAGFHLIYAATNSMPQGFYLVVPIKKISRYDIVEFIPPLVALNFIQENHWGPQNGSLIKYVFALPHDHVCIHHQAIWVNGKKIGKTYKFYAPNKLLPQTKICSKLKEGQYLLLSTKSERSFDGRYFGLITKQEILGRAIPMLALNKQQKTPGLLTNNQSNHKININK